MSLMIAALINILLSDMTPYFDYLLVTSRGKHVVVVVVADGEDIISVSTQGKIDWLMVMSRPWLSGRDQT